MLVSKVLAALSGLKTEEKLICFIVIFFDNEMIVLCCNCM